MVTAEQKRSWEEDGWCVLRRAIAPDRLAPAQTALAKLFPTPEEMSAAGTDDGSERWRTWDAAWPEFPFRSRSLNGLVVGDLMIDLAEELLGTEDVRMYLAVVSAKYAGQPSGYNQFLHTDFPNHTLTVPRPEAGYHQMETFVYLNDVGPHNGATRFVSRARTRSISVERHTLDFDEYAELYDDPSDAPPPPGRSSSTGPMCTTGRSTSPTRTQVHAPCLVQARRGRVGRLPGLAVQGVLTGVARPSREHRHVSCRSSAPQPGHPFWTDETLDGVALRYPASTWILGGRRGRPADRSAMLNVCAARAVSA